mgnify:CR=1 FL=1
MSATSLTWDGRSIPGPGGLPAVAVSLASRDRWHALDGLPPVDDLHGVAKVVAAALTQLG